MALVVGIGFVLTLLGGVVFAIKLYRVGITVGTRASRREELDLHPIRMRDILQTVLQDERTGIKYGKYLDRQVR